MLLPAWLLAPHPSEILPIPPPFFSLSLATHQSVTQSKAQQCRDTAAAWFFSLRLSFSPTVSHFSQPWYCQLFTARLFILLCSLCRSAVCRGKNQCMNSQMYCFFPHRLKEAGFFRETHLCLIIYCIFASRTTFCSRFLVYFSVWWIQLDSFSGCNWRQVPLWLLRVKRVLSCNS